MMRQSSNDGLQFKEFKMISQTSWIIALHWIAFWMLCDSDILVIWRGLCGISRPQWKHINRKFAYPGHCWVLPMTAPNAKIITSTATSIIDEQRKLRSSPRLSGVCVPFHTVQSSRVQSLSFAHVTMSHDLLCPSLVTTRRRGRRERRNEKII